MAVEIRDWELVRTKLPELPWVQRVAQHPLWNSLLQSEERQKFTTFNKTFSEISGQDLVQWSDEVLGQQVILAAYPHGSGSAMGVLLARVKHPEELHRLREAWEKLDQRQSAPRQYRGRTYSVSQKIKSAPNGAEQSGDHALYHALIDDVLVFSDREQALQGIIDQLENENAACVTEIPAFQRWQKRFDNGAFVRFFIQPRVRKLFPESADSNPIEQTVLKTIHSCETLGIGVRFEPDLVCDIIATFPGVSQTPAWQQAAARLGHPPEFLERTPASALFVLAGRHDLPALWIFVKPLLLQGDAEGFDASRQILRGLLVGYDPFDDVIGQLPPNFGLFLAEDTDTSLPALPLGLVAAVSLPSTPENSSKPVPLPKAIDNALLTGLSFVAAQISEEKQPVTVDSKMTEAAAVRWLSSVAGLHPGYAVQEQTLWLLSNARQAARWQQLTPEESLARTPWFQTVQQRYFPDAGEISLINLAACRQFGRTQRDRLVETIQSWHHVPPEKAAAGLERLDRWFSLTDVIFASATVRADEIQLTFGCLVQPAQE